jgi:predicted AAA+ superfamily ATPase
MYSRTIESQIKKWLFKNEVLIIYGARQVGKTTLAEEIARRVDPNYKYVDCDELANRQTLSSQDSNVLKKFVGNHKIVILDEAQRVENIGLNLKILHKNCPNTQFIATGSSSFDLANKINEPLTGRNIKFELYPFSLEELSSKNNTNSLNIQLEQILRFGLYPQVYLLSEDDKRIKLRDLSRDYLYRDLLATEKIKKLSSLEDVVRYLALCIGQELSFNSIAEKLQIDKGTVERYVALLEQAFVIFRLKPLYRNGVKEIRNPFKIYFWDVGLRNAVLDNYLPLSSREDVGRLWENFCVVERMKINNNIGNYKNYYFWRTKDQKEYDLIEEKDGIFEVFEIKWNEKREVKHHSEFFDNYKTLQTKAVTINKENWPEWLIGQ